MSTADETGIDSAPVHPDRDLLTRTRAALDHWSTHPSARTPTSSILATGAIAALEAAISAHHNDIPAMFLPSAGYALCIAMTALGIGPGDEVLLPALDWPASHAAVRNAGARPVPVTVDADTLTIDPRACLRAATPHTRAIVASHLHGVCADIPALRARLPHVPIIEDCAAAMGSTLDGCRAGTMGDIAVLSFGPGKQIYAGEGAILLTADPPTRRRALTASAHPLRVNLFGLEPDPTAVIVRPHPLAAILALHALHQWDPAAAAQAHRACATVLASDPAVTVLGYDNRRTNSSATVATLTFAAPPIVSGTTTAIVLPASQDGPALADLVSRIRRFPVGTLEPRPQRTAAATGAG